MALKATADRQKSLDELTAAIDESFEEVLADLEKLLAASGSQTRAGASQLGVLPTELLAHLHRLLSDLIEKDNWAVSGENDKREKGQTFRDAFKATRKELMRTRDHLRNVFGPEQADQLLLGVPRQIPRDMVAGLLRMCRNTLRQLRDPEVEVEVRPELKPTYPRGKETFVTLLKEQVDNLRRVNREYVRSQVRLAGYRDALRQAMEEYNRSFPEIAKIFVSLYRLAGHTKLAKLMQPSGQEKGLLLRLVKLRRAIKAGLKEAKKKRQAEASAKQASAKG